MTSVKDLENRIDQLADQIGDLKRDKELDILLAEYQAAHVNRDHYDSIRWIIGSIFIAASFTVLGISFVEPATRTPRHGLLLLIVSGGIFLVWLLYNWQIEPYNKLSIYRLQTIEKELFEKYKHVSPLGEKDLELSKWNERMGKKLEPVKQIPRLHTMINEAAPQGRGTTIVSVLIGIVIAALILSFVFLLR